VIIDTPPYSGSEAGEACALDFDGIFQCSCMGRLLGKLV
jgi:hypothetical protein